jgi:hypothetical protein
MPIMDIKIYISCLCAILIIGCKSIEKDNDCLSIDFNQVGNETELKMSDYVERIEYIPLESNDSCYLGRIKQVHFTKDYIFFSDRFIPRLLVFNKSGKFVRQIGREGKGPNEYPMLACFTTDSIGSEIFIYTVGDKILNFNLQGELRSEIKTNCCRFRHFSLINDHFVLNVSYPNNIMSDGYSCFVIDRNGNVTKKLLKRKFAENASIKDLGGFSSYCTKSESVLFWESEYDTIYEINKDLLVLPKYKLVYGEKDKSLIKSRIEFDDRIKNGAFRVTSFLELPKSIIFNAIEAGQLEQFIFNKQSHQLARVKKLTRIFRNEIDNGPVFQIAGLISDNIAYGLIDPNDLIGFFNSLKDIDNKDSYWKEIFKYKEDNNPIVVICHLKKY